MTQYKESLDRVDRPATVYGTFASSLKSLLSQRSSRSSTLVPQTRFIASKTSFDGDLIEGSSFCNSSKAHFRISNFFSSVIAKSNIFILHINSKVEPRDFWWFSNLVNKTGIWVAQVVNQILRWQKFGLVDIPRQTFQINRKNPHLFIPMSSWRAMGQIWFWMKNRQRKIQINSTNSYREFAIIFMVFYPVYDLNNRYYELVIFCFYSCILWWIVLYNSKNLISFQSL